MSTATATNDFALSSNAFQKCVPAMATNIKQCGTVTTCNAKPLTSGQLQSVYTNGTDYNVMEALFHHDFEIKMCEAVQNGLYDFLMANKVNVSKRLSTRRINSGLIEIAPFVMGRQYSPINNEYWIFNDALAVGGGNLQIVAQTAGNIPPDTRFFYGGERLALFGQTNGGTATTTYWQISTTVAPVVINNNAVLMTLIPLNSGSYLPAAALSIANASQGFLVRIPANVNDYESFCAEPAALLNWKDVPFWVETMRTSMCKSELYDKWRSLLLADNALYREYGDLDDIERNRQLGADWQKRLVNAMLWGKAINANQTIANYNQLPSIPAYSSANPAFATANAGQCVGFRANMVGLWEQMAQCGRVMDLQGAALDLPALFNSLYQMKRVREGQGSKMVEQFDIFTDSITAANINTAMIAYYNNQSGGTLRLTLDVNQDVKKGEFGFNYRSYNLFYPTVRINIISHYYFDDLLSAATAANVPNIGRMLWVLDFAGIYPGILETNRIVNKTGNLKTLAEIDTGFACVMKVPTQEQTLTSVTMTMIVECPNGNLMIQNFAPGVPTAVDANPPTYPTTSSTTSTTTTI